MVEGLTTVRVGLLGPLEAEVGGRALAVPSLKQRQVLATLALRANRPVAVAGLIDVLWDDAPPANAAHTLQQHISGLRKLLGPERPHGRARILETRAPGYLLHVDRVDVDEFEAAADAGFEGADAGDDQAAIASFDAALACWRGAALADVQGCSHLQAVAVRLEEKKLAVQEQRIDALLGLERSRELVGELEELVGRHPLRERLRAQLMLALYRGGRQAQALAVYQQGRTALVEGLGIEPGTALRELERAILEQSPSLDLSAADPGDPRATFPSDSGYELGRVQLPDGQIVVLPAGRNLIGRDSAALIRLVDNRVSRIHAHIEASESGCTLSDLGSSNGTTVNGAAVDEHELADGDVIGLGGVEVRFTLPPPRHGRNGLSGA